MGRPLAAISWSGGKDSCAALLRARSTFDIVAAVTMFTEDGGRSRSHGLRPEVIAAQVDRLGLRGITGRCTWDSYDAAFDRALGEAADLGVTHVIFGDILFDEHRQWAERLSSGRGLTAVEPLWGESTTDLYREFLASGTRARIVTVRASKLDDTFLGRDLAECPLDDFVARGVDPCGERGEYHTVVTSCAAFTAPLHVRAIGRAVNHGCVAEDLVLHHEDEPRETRKTERKPRRHEEYARGNHEETKTRRAPRGTQSVTVRVNHEDTKNTKRNDAS